MAHCRIIGITSFSAIQHLDKIQWHDRQIRVATSKHNNVQMPKEGKFFPLNSVFELNFFFFNGSKVVFLLQKY